MRPYMICTDTGADIFWRTAQQQRIEIAHLRYTLNGNDSIYDLGRSMDYGAFYKAMRSGEHVKATPVKAQTYCALWQPALHSGSDILYLGVSSKLSSSFAEAVKAREQMLNQYKDRRIVLVDTHCCSVAQGMLCFEAAQMRLEEKELFDVANWAVNNRSFIHGLLLQSDTTYLKQAGLYRGLIRKTAVLALNSLGALETVASFKNADEAQDFIASYISQNGYALSKQVIGIVHADAPESAGLIRDKLISDTECEQATILHMGPITGSIAGPGAVAIGFFGNRRE